MTSLRSITRPQRRRGFTLLEALICVGMLVLLLGALALFVEDLATTRQMSARTAAQTRSADALFNALEVALQTAVVDGGSLGAGISGTDRSIRVLSSRTDAGSGSVSQLLDAAFTPLSATQVDEIAGTVTLGRSGVSSQLPAAVRALRIRFWTDAGWSDSFDSLREGTLPAAVEVALWFGAAQVTVAKVDAGQSNDLAASDAEDLGAPDRIRLISVPDAAQISHSVSKEQP